MIYGLIGRPLGHSFSAEIHARLGREPYELRELAEEEVGPFLRSGEFRGINVTIPYKQAVMPFLDEISETAREIGAVNTVVRRDGRLYGDNTDAAGLRGLLDRLGADLRGKKVLILGTGGTSRTARYVSIKAGAREVIRVSRTAREGAVTYAQAARDHGDAEILINTTPCGMYPHNGDCPAAGHSRGGRAVYADRPGGAGGGAVPGYRLSAGYRGKNLPAAAGGKGKPGADRHAGQRQKHRFRGAAAAERQARGGYRRAD